MAGVNAPYRYQYEHVAVSQTAHVLGGTGAIGDYLDKLVCTVSTAATSSVTILDGAVASHVVLPNNVGGGIGVYVIPLGTISRNGAWKITTAAGVEVLAVGIFSA
jgi:hypothetical protein